MRGGREPGRKSRPQRDRREAGRLTHKPRTHGVHQPTIRVGAASNATPPSACRRSTRTSGREKAAPPSRSRPAEPPLPIPTESLRVQKPTKYVTRASSPFAMSSGACGLHPVGASCGECLRVECLLRTQLGRHGCALPCPTVYRCPMLRPAAHTDPLRAPWRGPNSHSDRLSPCHRPTLLHVSRFPVLIPTSAPAHHVPARRDGPKQPRQATHSRARSCNSPTHLFDCRYRALLRGDTSHKGGPARKPESL